MKVFHAKTQRSQRRKATILSLRLCVFATLRENLIRTMLLFAPIDVLNDLC
jgi:hypothetical protein